MFCSFFFFFQAEDGIRDGTVTGVQTCALPILDMPVLAFKVGMVGSIENIAAIAEVVSDYPDVPLVFDPVLASGRGDELATEDMISAMCELLLPQTTILTPNSREAR